MQTSPWEMHVYQKKSSTMKNSSLFWAITCCIGLSEAGPSSILSAEKLDEEHRVQQCTGKKITVMLTVPDSAWKITIDAVHQVRGEIWVVSTVSRDPNAIGLQVISTVRDSVKVEVPPAVPVKHFVIGKTWNWGTQEGYTFLKSRKEIEKDLQAGKLLYARVKPVT